MAIKKIIFKNLTATGSTYTSMGGIRFYDKSGTLIPPGTLLAGSTSTVAETENFKLVASSAYSANYSVFFAFNTALTQATLVYPNQYWLTSTDNQTLTIEFKNIVERISKIEFVLKPDSSISDRTVDQPFLIEVYDENSQIIKTYDVTPNASANRNTVEMINTPELSGVSKILLLSEDGKAKNVMFGKSASPNMTANNAPYGEVKASTFYSSYYPWKAFDGLASNWTSGWLSDGISNQWISYSFPKETYVDTYEIYGIAGDKRMPKLFRFEGSNDGVNWTLLDDRNLPANEWIAGWNTFSLGSKAGTFKTYRLYCTSNDDGANYIIVPEIRMKGLDKKVIMAPGTTEKDFLLYGMDAFGLSSIDYAEDFEKKVYVNETSNQLGAGKVFEQPLDLAKIIKKVKVT